MTATLAPDALRLAALLCNGMEVVHRALGDRGRLDRSPALGLMLIGIWRYLRGCGTSSRGSRR